MTKTAILVACVCLLFSSLGLSQATQQTNQMDAVLNSITVGARFSYFKPKLDNQTAAFSALGDTLGLAGAPDFKISYLAGAFVRYAITPEHSVGVDWGMSLAKSRLPHAESIERIYTIGAQYYYSFRDRNRYYLGADLGAGGGLMLANFERDFDNQRLSVLEKTFTANASVVGWMAPIHGLFLELEVRYVFVPNVKTTYPQSTLRMSSLALGGGISVAL